MMGGKARWRKLKRVVGPQPQGAQVPSKQRFKKDRTKTKDVKRKKLGEEEDDEEEGGTVQELKEDMDQHEKDEATSALDATMERDASGEPYDDPHIDDAQGEGKTSIQDGISQEGAEAVETMETNGALSITEMQKSSVIATDVDKDFDSPLAEWICDPQGEVTLEEELKSKEKDGMDMDDIPAKAGRRDKVHLPKVSGDKTSSDKNGEAADKSSLSEGHGISNSEKSVKFFISDDESDSDTAIFVDACQHTLSGDENCHADDKTTPGEERLNDGMEEYTVIDLTADSAVEHSLEGDDIELVIGDMGEEEDINDTETHNPLSEIVDNEGVVTDQTAAPNQNSNSQEFHEARGTSSNPSSPGNYVVHNSNSSGQHRESDSNMNSSTGELTDAESGSRSSVSDHADADSISRTSHTGSNDNDVARKASTDGSIDQDVLSAASVTESTDSETVSRTTTETVPEETGSTSVTERGEADASTRGSTLSPDGSSVSIKSQSIHGMSPPETGEPDAVSTTASESGDTEICSKTSGNGLEAERTRTSVSESGETYGTSRTDSEYSASRTSVSEYSGEGVSRSSVSEYSGDGLSRTSISEAGDTEEASGASLAGTREHTSKSSISESEFDSESLSSTTDLLTPKEEVSFALESKAKAEPGDSAVLSEGSLEDTLLTPMDKEKEKLIEIRSGSPVWEDLDREDHIRLVEDVEQPEIPGESVTKEADAQSLFFSLYPEYQPGEGEVEDNQVKAASGNPKFPCFRGQREEQGDQKDVYMAMEKSDAKGRKEKRSKGSFTGKINQIQNKFSQQKKSERENKSASEPEGSSPRQSSGGSIDEQQDTVSGTSSDEQKPKSEGKGDDSELSYHASRDWSMPDVLDSASSLASNDHAEETQQLASDKNDMVCEAGQPGEGIDITKPEDTTATVVVDAVTVEEATQTDQEVTAVTETGQEALEMESKIDNSVKDRKTLVGKAKEWIKGVARIGSRKEEIVPEKVCDKTEAAESIKEAPKTETKRTESESVEADETRSKESSVTSESKSSDDEKGKKDEANGLHSQESVNMDTLKQDASTAESEGETGIVSNGGASLENSDKTSTDAVDKEETSMDVADREAAPTDVSDKEKVAVEQIPAKEGLQKVTEDLSMLEKEIIEEVDKNLKVETGTEEEEMKAREETQETVVSETPPEQVVEAVSTDAQPPESPAREAPVTEHLETGEVLPSESKEKEEILLEGAHHLILDENAVYETGPTTTEPDIIESTEEVANSDTKVNGIIHKTENGLGTIQTENPDTKTQEIPEIRTSEVDEPNINIIPQEETPRRKMDESRRHRKGREKSKSPSVSKDSDKSRSPKISKADKEAKGGSKKRKHHRRRTKSNEGPEMHLTIPQSTEAEGASPETPEPSPVEDEPTEEPPEVPEGIFLDVSDVLPQREQELAATGLAGTIGEEVSIEKAEDLHRDETPETTQLDEIESTAEKKSEDKEPEVTLTTGEERDGDITVPAIDDVIDKTYERESEIAHKVTEENGADVQDEEKEPDAAVKKPEEHEIDVLDQTDDEYEPAEDTTKKAEGDLTSTVERGYNDIKESAEKQEHEAAEPAVVEFVYVDQEEVEKAEHEDRGAGTLEEQASVQEEPQTVDAEHQTTNPRKKGSVRSSKDKFSDEFWKEKLSSGHRKHGKHREEHKSFDSGEYDSTSPSRAKKGKSRESRHNTRDTDEPEDRKDERTEPETVEERQTDPPPVMPEGDTGEVTESFPASAATWSPRVGRKERRSHRKSSERKKERKSLEKSELESARREEEAKGKLDPDTQGETPENIVPPEVPQIGSPVPPTPPPESKAASKPSDAPPEDSLTQDSAAIDTSITLVELKFPEGVSKPVSPIPPKPTYPSKTPVSEEISKKIKSDEKKNHKRASKIVSSQPKLEIVDSKTPTEAPPEETVTKVTTTDLLELRFPEGVSKPLSPLPPKITDAKTVPSLDEISKIKPKTDESKIDKKASTTAQPKPEQVTQESAPPDTGTGLLELKFPEGVSKPLSPIPPKIQELTTVLVPDGTPKKKTKSTETKLHKKVSKTASPIAKRRSVPEQPSKAPPDKPETQDSATDTGTTLLELKFPEGVSKPLSPLPPKMVESKTAPVSDVPSKKQESKESKLHEIEASIAEAPSEAPPVEPVTEDTGTELLELKFPEGVSKPLSPLPPKVIDTSKAPLPDVTPKKKKSDETKHHKRVSKTVSTKPKLQTVAPEAESEALPEDLVAEDTGTALLELKFPEGVSKPLSPLPPKTIDSSKEPLPETVTKKKILEEPVAEDTGTALLELRFPEGVSKPLSPLPPKTIDTSKAPLPEIAIKKKKSDETKVHKRAPKIASTAPKPQTVAPEEPSEAQPEEFVTEDTGSALLELKFPEGVSKPLSPIPPKIVDSSKASVDASVSKKSKIDERKIHKKATKTVSPRLKPESVAPEALPVHEEKIEEPHEEPVTQDSSMTLLELKFPEGVSKPLSPIPPKIVDSSKAVSESQIVAPKGDQAPESPSIAPPEEPISEDSTATDTTTTLLELKFPEGVSKPLSPVPPKILDSSKAPRPDEAIKKPKSDESKLYKRVSKAISSITKSRSVAPEAVPEEPATEDSAAVDSSAALLELKFPEGVSKPLSPVPPKITDSSKAPVSDRASKKTKRSLKVILPTAKPRSVLPEASAILESPSIAPPEKPVTEDSKATDTTSALLELKFPEGVSKPLSPVPPKILDSSKAPVPRATSKKSKSDETKLYKKVAKAVSSITKPRSDVPEALSSEIAKELVTEETTTTLLELKFPEGVSKPLSPVPPKVIESSKVLEPEAVSTIAKSDEMKQVPSPISESQSVSAVEELIEVPLEKLSTQDPSVTETATAILELKFPEGVSKPLSPIPQKIIDSTREPEPEITSDLVSQSAITQTQPEMLSPPPETLKIADDISPLPTLTSETLRSSDETHKPPSPVQKEAELQIVTPKSEAPILPPVRSPDLITSASPPATIDLLEEKVPPLVGPSLKPEKPTSPLKTLIFPCGISQPLSPDPREQLVTLPTTKTLQEDVTPPMQLAQQPSESPEKSQEEPKPNIELSQTLGSLPAPTSLILSDTLPKSEVTILPDTATSKLPPSEPESEAPPEKTTVAMDKISVLQSETMPRVHSVDRIPHPIADSERTASKISTASIATMTDFPVKVHKSLLSTTEAIKGSRFSSPSPQRVKSKTSRHGTPRKHSRDSSTKVQSTKPPLKPKPSSLTQQTGKSSTDHSALTTSPQTLGLTDPPRDTISASPSLTKTIKPVGDTQTTEKTEPTATEVTESSKVKDSQPTEGYEPVIDSSQLQADCKPLTDEDEDIKQSVEESKSIAEKGLSLEEEHKMEEKTTLAKTKPTEATKSSSSAKSEASLPKTSVPPSKAAFPVLKKSSPTQKTCPLPKITSPTPKVTAISKATATSKVSPPVHTRTSPIPQITSPTPITDSTTDTITSPTSTMPLPTPQPETVTEKTATSVLEIETSDTLSYQATSTLQQPSSELAESSIPDTVTLSQQEPIKSLSSKTCSTDTDISDVQLEPSAEETLPLKSEQPGLESTVDASSGSFESQPEDPQVQSASREEDQRTTEKDTLDLLRQPQYDQPGLLGSHDGSPPSKEGSQSPHTGSDTQKRARRKKRR
ncbi:hypothetical protein OTU49_015925 [Cherax quadricarinatus]|uniref:Uncharacterized protein n=2 Tax=Cherax quadricarinatus TaxID=27406 RepID=A0AAW0XXW9_CHEQU